VSRFARCLGAVAVAALLHATLNAAPPEGKAGLVARIRAVQRKTDFRASGKLVRVGASGERRAYQVSMRGLATGDAISMFCEVTGPPAARMRVLMERRADGSVSVRLGRPGDARPAELPFANWADPLLDSDLSYEDLLETHFSWARQTLLDDAEYGARKVYVLRSEPGPADRSHYASVTAWLDRLIAYPVKVEKVVKRSGAVKEFIYYGLRQSNGLWSASQVEARTKGRPGSTFLIINRGTGKANLTARDFDPQLLVAAH
jgi:hypothetical protein